MVEGEPQSMPGGSRRVDSAQNRGRGSVGRSGWVARMQPRRRGSPSAGSCLGMRSWWKGTPGLPGRGDGRGGAGRGGGVM